MKYIDRLVDILTLSLMKKRLQQLTEILSTIAEKPVTKD